MAMAKAASGLFLIISLLFLVMTVRGDQHTVGGSDGWSQSADLATWASGETFTVGDTLLFSYSGLHQVDIVDKDAYGKCVTGKALKSYNDGQTVISLSKPGTMYFICPTSNHCSGGMKLAITVVAAASSTPTTPATTSPPPSTAAPSGDKTPSVYSPPSDSTPTSDGSSDTNTTPTSTTTPSTTKESPKSEGNGAKGRFGNFNGAMLGFPLVVAGLVSFTS